MFSLCSRQARATESDTPWSDTQLVRDEDGWTSGGKTLEMFCTMPQRPPAKRNTSCPPQYAHHSPALHWFPSFCLSPPPPHHGITPNKPLHSIPHLRVCFGEEHKLRQSKGCFFLLAISPASHATPSVIVTQWRVLRQWYLIDWIQIPTLPLTSCINKLILLSGPPLPI